MTRPGFRFSTRFRVRYSEIDGQKIVFNSRYLEYSDVAVTEFWRWADLSDLGPDWTEAEFNIVKAVIDYRKALRFDDLVEAWVRIEKVGTSSMVTRVDLCHAETGDLHASAEIVSVLVDLEERKSRPIPANIRDRLLTLTA